MDALLIPAFIFLLVLVPVVAVVLLLYAAPIWITARLVRNETMQAYTLVVSWAGLGIRTSGTGTGRVTEVLIGNSPVISRTGSMSSPTGKRAGQPSDKTMPDQTVTPGDDSPPLGVSPDDIRIQSSLNAGRIIPTIRQLAGPAASLGGALWRAGRFVDAKGKVTLGLGDPVLTGEVCGIYWASRFVLQASRVYVELEPVFDREVLGMDITVRLKVNHPLLVLIAAVRFARDPGVRSASDILSHRPTGAPAS